MPDIWMDVDAALAEVPVNIMPLLDDTDFKSREVALPIMQAGMDLVWNFVTTGRGHVPDRRHPHNWRQLRLGPHRGWYVLHRDPGIRGASINNDTEGFGWFTGLVTGVLPWRGPIIGFRAAGLNNVTDRYGLQYQPGAWPAPPCRMPPPMQPEDYPYQTPEAWTWTPRSRQILTPSWKIPVQP